jgi:hypothetical protein
MTLLPPEMHEYTFVQLLKDSPEWVGVCATSLFATLTAAIIFWQVLVMKAQTRISLQESRRGARHDRQQNVLLHSQNRLIRYQFEYEWLKELNADRLSILDELRSVYVKSNLMASQEQAPEGVWAELKSLILDLDARLRMAGAFLGKDEWYDDGYGYIAHLTSAVAHERAMEVSMRMAAHETPNAETRKAFLEGEQLFKPVFTLAKIENSIRLEAFKFKKSWDSEFSRSSESPMS